MPAQSPPQRASADARRPWWRLIALSGLLLISIINGVVLRSVAPTISPATAADTVLDLPFLQVWMISFLPYLFACAFVLATPPSKGRWLMAELGLILLGAGLLRLLLLPAPPVLSRDSWRYLWDAKVTLNGFSPYVYRPVDAAVRPLVDNILFPNMRFRTAPTIYPPGAQFVYLLSYLIAQSNLYVLKGIFFLFDMATCVALMVLLKRKGIDPRRAVLYAWSPLPIVEFAINGHVDVITLTVTLLAWLSADNTSLRGRLLTGFLIGFSALTKIYPILLLAIIIPELLREAQVNGRIVLSRIRGRSYALVLVSLLTIALGYLPYLILGHGQILGYFATFASEQGENAGAINLALQWLGTQLGLNISTLLALEHVVELLSIGITTLVVFALRLRDRISREMAALLLFGVVLAISSHVFPWYTTILLLWIPALLWTPGSGRRGVIMNISNQDRQEGVMLSAAKHLRVPPASQMLRCAQHDNPFPVLVVHIHHRVRVATLDRRRGRNESRPYGGGRGMLSMRMSGLSGKGLAVIAVWYFSIVSIFGYYPVPGVTGALAQWTTYYLIAYKPLVIALAVAALFGIVKRFWLQKE
jgi:hypothetical protein